MKKYEYKYFIEPNVAPYGATGITVKDAAGKTVGRTSLGTLKLPEVGEKLYSIGVLSDVHVTDGELARERFEKALSFLAQEEHVAFTVIAGDLTKDGIANAEKDEYKAYRDYVAEYAKGIPVYPVTGNHDVDVNSPAPFESKDSTIPYTGYPLYYEVEQGDDLFLMVGMSGWPGKTGEIFTTEELDWLSDMLAKNADKRCFVVEHVPYMEYANGVCSRATSGALIGWKLPTGNLLNQGTNGKQFSEIIEGRNNVLWLHGHSHMEFWRQELQSHVNYDDQNQNNEFGRHSLHVPSLATGRMYDEAKGWLNNDSFSGGYVADIYKDYVVFRGYNFAEDRLDPLVMFCVETS